MLSKVIDNTFYYDLNNRDILREVTVKIGLEKIDTQEEVIVEVLLDSSTTGLVMSSDFVRKQGFKLKKIDKPIYIRNVNGSFNKKGTIKHTVEINVYYQWHRKRTEIDMIGGQKQSVILEILQLACHNPESNWRTGKVKMMRCLEEYGKQQRPKQGKPGWQKQKKEEKKQRKEEQKKKQKNDRDKESGRRMRDLG